MRNKNARTDVNLRSGITIEHNRANKLRKMKETCPISVELLQQHDPLLLCTYGNKIIAPIMIAPLIWKITPDGHRSCNYRVAASKAESVFAPARNNSSHGSVSH